jgi:hypothetical protein
MTEPPESEGGWQSNWQRPQEGEWKQAPDGSWYKDTSGAAPPPPTTSWEQRPEAPVPNTSWEQRPQPPAPASRERTPGVVAAPGASSGKAVAALILGIGGLTFCPLILSVFALVLGYQARAEIDRSGGAVGGRGQATAGIILGWIGVVFLVALIALIVIGLAVGDTSSTSSGGGSFQLN